MTKFFQHVRVPLALLLAATLLCSLFGCAALYEGNLSEILDATDPADVGSDVDAPGGERLFSLSYYTEEALNPYTSSSRTNAELLRLCYSGLFTVDDAYRPKAVMADSYEVDGNSVLIYLRSDLRFSDGSPVTAADCAASFDRAKKSDSIWSQAFSYIRSYSAESERVFKVVFRAYSQSQLNLLDIPIVKRGTADGGSYPVGCGRYRISSADGFELVKADCGCISGAYEVDRISLLGIADQEALIYNFNYGRLQAVCADLSLGADEYRSDSELVTVPTNRITFIVVNRSRKELADVNFSKGLTYLLDRNALVQQAVNSFGTPVWYPLNPAWSETVAAGLNPDIQSLSLASEAFTQAGFLLNGTERVYEKKPVSLRLLVNRENSARVKAAERIGEALRGAGFTVEVVQATWDEYQIAVKNLDFDLYLGEVNLPANMDLSALFSSAVCNTGEEEGTYGALLADAGAVLSGDVDIRTFVSNFQNALPFVPLYYSRDALAVSMDVTGSFGGSVSELYSGIENWSLKTH